MAATPPTTKFWAFISYSSKDRKWGQWLHRRLENYPIPEQFQGAKLFDGAVLGKNLRPVFRDRDELSGSSELGPAILKALQETRYLIVLCSRNSAKSEWVNKEIEDFKALGRENRILALILDGVPNASQLPDVADSEECFPPALRYPAEPLAGDLRKEGDGKERGFLKILAGAAELDFDALYRRHERLQRRRRMLTGALASLVILALAALSVFALLQKKEAVRQRGVAETNQKISERQAREAEISLSNKLLEQGLDALKTGMTEEGLALLASSLRTWPDNHLARDRMLFELSYRSWFLTTRSDVLPFQLLVDALPPPPKDSEINSSIDFRESPGKGMTLSEELRSYNAETDESVIRRRESTWSPEHGWTAGRETTVNAGDAAPPDETIDIGGGRSLVSEPTEAPRGFWDVTVQGEGDVIPFRARSYDGKTLEAVMPFGVPSLSPDGRTIAVVGFQSAAPVESDERNYEPDGTAYVSFFDAGTLVQNGSDDFGFPIAKDADIVRVWWSGSRLGIHSRQDNRRLDRFDWIDFSGKAPVVLATNKGIKADLWFFDDGRLHLFRRFRNNDGKTSVRHEVQELKSAGPMDDGVDALSEKDFVWFSEQRDSGDPVGEAGLNGSWTPAGNTALFSEWLNTGTNQACSPVSSGNGRRASMIGDGSVRISRQEGPAFNVPVARMSGEGGRQINGLGFSPDGEYVVVKGFSAGGGVADWELLGVDVGLPVYPVVFPRNRTDLIQLVPLYERAGMYGLEAVAWSIDGRFLMLGMDGNPGDHIFGEKAYQKLWRNDLFKDTGTGKFRGCFLLPLRFCEGSVPDWLVDAAERIIGLKSAGGGRFECVTSEGDVASLLGELCRSHAADSYGSWLGRFLRQPE